MLRCVARPACGGSLLQAGGASRTANGGREFRWVSADQGKAKSPRSDGGGNDARKFRLYQPLALPCLPFIPTFRDLKSLVRNTPDPGPAELSFRQSRLPKPVLPAGEVFWPPENPKGEC